VLQPTGGGNIYVCVYVCGVCVCVYVCVYVGVCMCMSGCTSGEWIYKRWVLIYGMGGMGFAYLSLFCSRKNCLPRESNRSCY
jgi:hypothetical protein